MSRVKFNQNGNLAKLVKKLQSVHNQRVQTGYFKEQGEHPTAEMTYAELMRIHEYGDGNFPARPVFKNLRFDIRNEIKPHLIKQLRMFVKNPTYTREHLFDSVGKWVADKAFDIFGNRGGNYLTVTYNPSPLIDTGSLESNFAYKVSFIGRVVTL